MKEEIWKDIPGYEAMYQAGSCGSIKSLERDVFIGDSVSYRIPTRILKENFNPQGYKILGLSKNSKTKIFQVHQLVAIAFLGHKLCGYKIVVDHINNIKTDNRVENLQLISQRINISKDKKDKSSNHIGIYLNKHNKSPKWVAQITINKKIVHLGSFEEEEVAAKVFKNAVKNIDKYNNNNKQFRELCAAI